MVQRKHAVAVAAVAGAAVGTLLTYRRRRARPAEVERPRVPSRRPRPVAGALRGLAVLLVAPAVMVRTILADFPDDLRDTAGIAFGGLWNVFTDFILAPLESVFNFLWRKLADSVLWVYNHVEYWKDLLQDLIYDIAGKVFALEHFVTDAIKAFVRGITDALQTSIWGIWDKINEFASWIYGAEQWLQNRIGNLLEDFFDAVIAPILGPILDFMDNLFDRVWDLIEDAVKAAIDAAFDALEFTGDLAGKIVGAGLNFLFSTGEDVVDVIRGVWHFAVWLFLHPEDALEKLVTTTAKNLVKNTGELVQSIVHENAGHVEDLVTDILGLK